MGIPFLILEYGLGFSLKKSFSKLMHDIRPEFEVIAWMLVLFVFIVVIYYMIILGWDFVYFLNSFTFGWGSNPSAFYKLRWRKFQLSQCNNINNSYPNLYIDVMGIFGQ